MEEDLHLGVTALVQEGEVFLAVTNLDVLLGLPCGLNILILQLSEKPRPTGVPLSSCDEGPLEPLQNVS